MAKKINMVLGGINVDIVWKRCIMSGFTTGVVATEDSDQLGNSHSQASCEKLKSAQRYSMTGMEELNPIHLVLCKENSLCMQETLIFDLVLRS